jgi:peroxin-7
MTVFQKECANISIKWTTYPTAGNKSLVRIHDAHSEFVVGGCAWSLFEEGVLATCSW